MKRALVFLALLAGAPAAAQDLGLKAPPQSLPVVIAGVTIHPVSGPPIEDGALRFEDGRILSVGGDVEVSVDVELVEADGLHLWPGMIAPWTQLGLTEIGAVRATRDVDEVGPFTPEVRAVVAVNPDSTLLPVARTNGVLLAGTFPTGGAVPGRGGVIRLDGWTWEDMAVRDDAGLVVSWPASRIRRRWWMEETDEELRTRARRNLDLLEREFSRAEAYLAARAADPSIPVDLRYEGMAPVLPGPGGEPPERPVFLLAGEHDQILGALGFAKRHGLRPVIVGGRDADLAVPEIREAGAAVIVTGVFQWPRRRDAAYDEVFSLPACLERAGIPWCLASGQGAANERNLPYAAAMAVAHGLDPDAAMRAITLSSAEILGIDGDYGSIEKGKSATMILTDGNPLDVPTQVLRAWIDGREIDLGNKQTALAAKYREKYRQLGIGR